MALTVTDVEQLRDYLCGVMARADHHAGNVKEIALALVGGILWRKDDGESIQVMTRDGQAKNVLWVTMGGRRYAFVYNHSTGEIDMRNGTLQGPLVHAFSNATPLATLQQIFQNL
ncbi:hypothetical protein [Hymenobacter baengnokdamensis]|uniref:hypothetical protein n=1 Tax=Hymenobacter baengnokdamensis TaxID=2615203 RepID=UPI0012471D98|nr:hypothetical protein [Hymenobacter baengnokdamensis]